MLSLNLFLTVASLIIFFPPLPTQSTLPAVAASQTCLRTAKLDYMHRHYPPYQK